GRGHWNLSVRRHLISVPSMSTRTGWVSELRLPKKVSEIKFTSQSGKRKKKKKKRKRKTLLAFRPRAREAGGRSRNRSSTDHVHSCCFISPRRSEGNMGLFLQILTASASSA